MDFFSIETELCAVNWTSKLRFVANSHTRTVYVSVSAILPIWCLPSLVVDDLALSLSNAGAN